MSQQFRPGQRMHYVDGQVLLAENLQTDSEYESSMRRLHVVALHNTWGIAIGLDVSADQSTLTVNPGLAYDCYGRELLLTQPVTIPFPDSSQVSQASAGLDLVVYYDDRPASERCAAERLRWTWRSAGCAQPGIEIVLGRYKHEKIWQFSPLGRHYARGAAHCNAAGGQQSIIVDAPALFDGYKCFIDTTSTGFQVTPYYFVTLVDFYPGILALASTPTGCQPLQFEFTGPYLSISSTSPGSFTVLMQMGYTSRLLACLNADKEFLKEFEQALSKRIVRCKIDWLGIEPFHA